MVLGMSRGVKDLQMGITQLNDITRVDRADLFCRHRQHFTNSLKFFAISLLDPFQQFGGIRQMARSFGMDTDAQIGVLPGQITGAAGMVEVNVRKRHIINVLGG